MLFICTLPFRNMCVCMFVLVEVIDRIDSANHVALLVMSLRGCERDPHLHNHSLFHFMLLFLSILRMSRNAVDQFVLARKMSINYVVSSSLINYIDSSL